MAESFASDIISHLSSWTVLLITVGFVSYYLQSTRSHFPVINAYPGDYTRRKAHAEYMRNARELIAEGLQKHKGPITLDTPSGPRIILPDSLTDWVKSNKDLDHQALVYHDFFGNYPGFEANAMIHHPNNIVIDTIKKKLSNNGRLVPIISEHVGEALDDVWGKGGDWHALNWVPDTMSLVSSAAASAFVGPRLARDTEWQRMTTTYATGFFAAAFELKRWPSWTRPIVHWFLPGARTCRKLVKDVRNAMNVELGRRQKAADAGIEKDHHDAIAWSQEIAGSRDVDHGGVQLAFAMAALFTTSEALRQVLIDICQHPSIIGPLGDEIKDAIGRDGLTQAALAKMHLLDSVMKESQRLAPPSIVTLEREAVRDVFLPDGTCLPRGSIVAVDSSALWNSKIHHDPGRFDSYRYLNTVKDGHDRTFFVSSTKEHNVFGMGKHVCPGRFLAAAEIKLCLAHILLKYDIRLQDGCHPETVQNGLFQMVDPTVRMDVKRRPAQNVLS